MYSCKTCGKQFEKHTSLAGHTVRHIIKLVPCKICGRNIFSNAIKLHQKWHKKDTNCLFCGKPVFGGHKFCNHSCCASFSNKKRGINPLSLYKCKGCEKQIKRNKFCSYRCRKEFLYKTYIARWLAGLESGNYGEDAVSAYIRRWVFQRAENKCEGILENEQRCNWAKINPYNKKQPLCVHHKDGNSRHTVPENLELLCPCCHSLTKNYGALNKGMGRNGRRRYRKNIQNN